MEDLEDDLMENEDEVPDPYVSHRSALPIYIVWVVLN